MFDASDGKPLEFTTPVTQGRSIHLHEAIVCARKKFHELFSRIFTSSALCRKEMQMFVPGGARLACDAVGWECRRWGGGVLQCCSSVPVGEDAVQVVVRRGVRGVCGEGRGQEESCACSWRAAPADV